MTTEQVLQIAVQHHQAARLAQAEQLYRKILDSQPNHAQAMHLLGVIAYQVGRNDVAADLMRRSIAINASDPSHHCNLGEVYRALGRFGEAVASYSLAIQLKPDYAEAYNNLGSALCGLNKLDQAIAAFSKAIELNPALAEAHTNLANALQAQGKLDEAATSYLRAIQLNPVLAEAYCKLGNVLMAQRKFDTAVAVYRKAIELKPAFVEAWFNLAACRQGQFKLDDAVDAYSTVIRLDPNCMEAHTNLGNLLKDQGRLDEALAAYERAMVLRPNETVCHSNWVYAMHFHSGFDARAIYEAHRRWNEQHAARVPLMTDFRDHPAPDPGRKLRIGYVSPNLNFHPVCRFLLPLLEQHDRGKFEVFCYSDVATPDDLTNRVRSQCDVWRHTAGMSDEQVAGLVRQDRIDILVDLAMHMARNRLLVFARKPAPVQVTYLAYCSTTGLDAIDYRFTDPWLDPPGCGDACYSEQSIRLPQTYWCYAPGIAAPAPGPLPALSAGHMTFGCLNNFNKVSALALETWCRLMRETPGSRFVLQAEEGRHRQRVIDALHRAAVDPQRLRFVAYMSGPDYFRLYQEIDLTLDPFPCAGGTTSCDALWMGVPVVTLAGGTAVGRSGVSILSNVGLPELIAGSQDQYLDIARQLAGDLPRLAELRAGLRQRMLNSPLTDAPRFARNVEAAYDAMWRQWCEKRRLRAD